MKTRLLLLIVIGLGFGLAAPALSAQAWDVPSFMPPRPGDDVGVYLTDQGDFGLSGIWRQQGAVNLGVRVGYVDAAVGDGSVLVGVETWGGLFVVGPEFPVDVNWTLGGGASFNDALTVLSVPGGVTVGRTFEVEPYTVQVYGHPRLVLDLVSFNNEIDLDLDGVVDLGGEVHLGDAWKRRVAVSLGSADALGIGLAYRFARTVEVR